MSRAIKRVLDMVFAATTLIVLSPVFLLTAVAIWVHMGLPLLFRHQRAGFCGQPFVMLKFRTMTDEKDENGYWLPDADRLTRLGRLLRKSSIDELPQLWNVVKGDMSLVGPRAMSLRDYALFDQDWQRRRFSVKPGITCLWQVNGRNSVPFEQWMELDMQYIDKWSLWLDLKILALTVPAVLRGAGAA